MSWLQGILQAHPEIAFFLVLGLGYLFGKLALGSFKLGAVTGTLLAGVLVGSSASRCRTKSSSVSSCCSCLPSGSAPARSFSAA